MAAEFRVAHVGRRHGRDGDLDSVTSRASLYQRPFEESFTCSSLETIGRPELEHGDKILMPVRALKRIQHLKIPFPLLFEISNRRASLKNTRPSKRSVRQEYRDRLRRIYEKHNAMQKWPKVEGHLSAYVGSEHKLYIKICSKYSEEPEPRYDGRVPVSNSGFKQYCSVLEFTAPEDKTIHIPNWMMTNLNVKEGDRVKLKSVFNVEKGKYVKLLPKKAGFIKLIDRMGPKFLLENSMRHFSVLSKGENFQIKVGDDTWDLSVLETRPDPDKICILGHVDLSVDVEPPKENENSSSDDSSFVAGQTIDLSGGQQPDEDDEMMAGPNPQFTKEEQDEMFQAIKASLDAVLAEEKEQETEIATRRELPDQQYQAPAAAAADNGPVPAGMVRCPHCVQNVNESAFMMHEMHCARQKQGCAVCGARLHGTELAAHMKMWHDPAKCDWCGVEKAGQRNLMRHKIKCVKRPTPCDYCGATVPLDQKFVHLASCDLAHTACKCGKRVRTTLLALHQYEECPARRAACTYCKLPFKIPNIAAHAKPCGSRSEPCYLCGKYVTLALMNDHVDSGCASYTNEQRSVPKEETSMRSALHFADADIDALMDDSFGPDYMSRMSGRMSNPNPAFRMSAQERQLQRALQASMAESGSAPAEGTGYEGVYSAVNQVSSMIAAGASAVGQGLAKLASAAGVIDEPSEELTDEERLRRAIEASMSEAAPPASAPPEKPPEKPPVQGVGRQGTDATWGDSDDGDDGAGWDEGSNEDAPLVPNFSSAKREDDDLAKAIAASLKDSPAPAGRSPAPSIPASPATRKLLDQMQRRPRPAAARGGPSMLHSSVFRKYAPRKLRDEQAKPNLRVQLTGDAGYFKQMASLNGIDMSTRQKVLGPSPSPSRDYLGQKGTIVKVTRRSDCNLLGEESESNWCYVRWDSGRPSLELPATLLEGIRNDRGDFKMKSSPLADQFKRIRASPGYGRQRSAERAGPLAATTPASSRTPAERLGGSAFGKPYRSSNARPKERGVSAGARRKPPPINRARLKKSAVKTPKARNASTASKDSRPRTPPSGGPHGGSGLTDVLRRLRSLEDPASGRGGRSTAALGQKSGTTRPSRPASGMARVRDGGAGGSSVRRPKPKVKPSLSARSRTSVSSERRKSAAGRRPISSRVRDTSTAAGKPAAKAHWSCPKCTFKNKAVRSTCAVCSAKRVVKKVKPRVAKYRPAYRDSGL